MDQFFPKVCYSSLIPAFGSVIVLTLDQLKLHPWQYKNSYICESMRIFYVNIVKEEILQFSSLNNQVMENVIFQELCRVTLSNT